MIEKSQEIVKMNERIQKLEDIVQNREESGKPFMDCEDLNATMKELFVEEILFKCPHCEYKTASEKGIKIHESRKHKKKCEVCDQNFSSLDTLSTHICRGGIENFEDENCELQVNNERLKCYLILKRKPPNSDSGTATTLLLHMHSTSCWMNVSLGCKSCPDLPFPHRPDVLIEKDESDDFPSYHIWMDTLVFDKVMDWTGMEKILLDNHIIL